MNEMNRVRLLLAMQTALLGRVGSSMRCVSCEFRGGCIYIRAIFDGEVLDEYIDLMDEVGSEVVSHFNNEMIKVECVRLDAPKDDVNIVLKWCVYKRFERF